MTRQNVVITGANSYLGSRIVADLLRTCDCDIYAVVSPWSDRRHNGVTERLHYIRADLQQRLAPEVTGVLASADRVLHLAWVRGRDLQITTRVNEDIIHKLMDVMLHASRFYFFSSVAAAPNALSTYALVKWKAARLVQAKGGSVLVCGLVVDANPRGPYKMLSSFVKNVPLALRLTCVPQVYPIHIDDVVACVRHVIVTETGPGSYKMFAADGTDFNRFISILEETYPSRRIKLRLNARLIVGAASFLKRSRLIPSELCEKLLTFLYKDADYLQSHQEIPGIKMNIWSDTFSIG